MYNKCECKSPAVTKQNVSKALRLQFSILPKKLCDTLLQQPLSRSSFSIQNLAWIIQSRDDGWAAISTFLLLLHMYSGHVAPQEEKNVSHCMTGNQWGSESEKEDRLVPGRSGREKNLKEQSFQELRITVESYGLSWFSADKESVCNVGDPSSIPGLGGSLVGRLGNPLQYSCLENPHGQRSLVDYSPWGHKELDMTEGLSTAHSIE